MCPPEATYTWLISFVRCTINSQTQSFLQDNSFLLKDRYIFSSFNGFLKMGVYVRIRTFELHLLSSGRDSASKSSRGTDLVILLASRAVKSK